MMRDRLLSEIHYFLNESVSFVERKRDNVIGLHAFLSKPEVSIYKNVIPILNTMIAKHKTHAIEWSQLNKGAHEEDKAEEFDKAIVKEILDLMAQIENAVKNGGTVALAPAQAIAQEK